MQCRVCNCSVRVYVVNDVCWQCTMKATDRDTPTPPSPIALHPSTMWALEAYYEGLALLRGKG